MFITFEGPEGSGKSTQIARARHYLANRGLVVVRTREPGGTPISDKIRAVLVDAANQEMTAKAEVFLYFAARAQHVTEKIHPALAQGEIVLCDRFADSTWAYQGYARGLGTDLIEKLNDIATDGLTPDLTLLYDLPVEVGLARARERADALAEAEREDRFEREELEFHRKLREGFLKLAERDAHRFCIIDAAGTIEQVWERTKTILDNEVIGRNV